MIGWKEYHAKSDLGSRRMRVRDIVLIYLQQKKTAQYRDILAHVTERTDIYPADIREYMSAVLYHLERGGYIKHSNYKEWTYVQGADTCTSAPALSTWVQYNARRELAAHLREEVPSIEDLILRILSKKQEVQVSSIRLELSTLTGIKLCDLCSNLTYTLQRMRAKGLICNTKRGYWRLATADDPKALTWREYSESEATPISELVVALLKEHIELPRYLITHYLLLTTSIDSMELYNNLGSVLRSLEAQNVVYRTAAGDWRIIL